MDFVRKKLAIVGMLLAVAACEDNFVGVCHRQRPVKPFAESFADKGPFADVRRAHAHVDLL